MDPVSTFIQSMNATGSIIRGMRQDRRNDELHSMKMDAYATAKRRDDEAYERKGKVRDAAGALAQQYGVGGSPAPGAEPAKASDGSFTLGSVDDALDPQKQAESMQQLMPLLGKAASGQQLTDQEREPILAAGGALAYSGVIPTSIPEVRNQAQAAGQLKTAIAQIGEKAGGQLVGKRTRITVDQYPELFNMFSQTFPAVAGGSKGFKEGRFVPVEFFVDGTGVDDIRQARVTVVGEGVNPQTGESYRAPMTVGRTGNPDDGVMATPLGELYGRADFAQMSANALLATVVGNDDAAAQKYLDYFFGQAKALDEERRNRHKNQQVAGAISGLQGFSAEEQASIEKLVLAGSGLKDAANVVLSGRPKVEKGSITWRDNVSINGQPYHVGFDGRGQVVAQVPQYIKGSGGAGGAKSISGGGINKESWGRFAQQYDRQFLAELEALNPAGEGEDADYMALYNEAVTSGKRERFMDDQLSKAPEGLLERYNSGLQHGEMLMADGGILPVAAASKAYAFTNQPKGGGAQATGGGALRRMESASADDVIRFLGTISDVPGRIDAARAYLASNASEENKEKVRYEIEAQLAKVQGGMDSAGRIAEYRERLKSKPTPKNVQDTMFANVQQAVPDYGPGLDMVADFFFETSPAVIVGSGIAGLLRDFQAWAKAGGFNGETPDGRKQAMQEYAKKNPEKAKEIIKAAATSQAG